jgi:hypothetical protein
MVGSPRPNPPQPLDGLYKFQVNAGLLVWRGRTRLILDLLGPNESLIPKYLGQNIPEGIRTRLTA